MGEESAGEFNSGEIDRFLEDVFKEQRQYEKDISVRRETEVKVLNTIAEEELETGRYKDILATLPIEDTLSLHCMSRAMDRSEELKRQLAVWQIGFDQYAQETKELDQEISQAYWVGIFVTDYSQAAADEGGRAVVWHFDSKKLMQANIFIDPGLSPDWREGLMRAADKLFDGESFFDISDEERAALRMEAQATQYAEQVSLKRYKKAVAVIREALVVHAGKEVYKTAIASLALLAEAQSLGELEEDMAAKQLFAEEVLRYLGLDINSEIIQEAVAKAIQAIDAEIDN